MIDIWSSCRATTTSDQSQLKHSCWVHTGLPEVFISAVGSLHPHGAVTFWFTLFTTAPGSVFVLFRFFLSDTQKHRTKLSIGALTKWVILSKRSPQNLLIIPTTSVNPVHNAQVCYFNNVWLMFLVF